MHTKTKGAAPFLCRTEGGDLEIAMGKYSGAIPAKVLRMLARHVRRLAESGAIYPADPLDIYQHAFLELERRARNLSADVRSPEAYLATSARLIVLKARVRITGRMRAEYRQIEGVQRPDIQGGGCDQELDASCSDDERFSYDANDLAEMLVAPPDPRTTRRLAQQCLEETFEKLPPDTVKAFRAWIAADGVVGEAAHLCGESRFAYRRKWPARVAAFRAACKCLLLWRWCSETM